jgi:hypothetical protein
LFRAHAFPPIHPRGFPIWEELDEQDVIEKLPWYWPALDPDLEAALARHGLASGRVLDEGTGPATEAIALAERGFTVTASDVSAAAIAYAARKAKERRVDVNFVPDDILACRLTGPFEVIFDRGCFHVLAPEQRAGPTRGPRQRAGKATTGEAPRAPNAPARAARFRQGTKQPEERTVTTRTRKRAAIEARVTIARGFTRATTRPISPARVPPETLPGQPARGKNSRRKNFWRLPNVAHVCRLCDESEK